MKPDVSVVIGFRNWGIRRIRLAAEHISASFGRYVGEVIISDYGSTDPEPNRLMASSIGARYVYTPGDPNWSRSRALNAGFAVAEGNLLISTDADMLFSPRSMELITETAMQNPHSALFLQCRDLPPGYDDEFVSAHPNDWDEYERVSRLRPRWGLGGMMAISRSGFNKIRGFDERLHTYGGEDIDFAQRAARAGYRTHWLDDPDIRMYHMWHPPSRTIASQTAEGRAAIQFNKDIVYNDPTFIRNTLRWAHPTSDARPLVTVAIATKNRSDYLRETLQSVLAQTVHDFEAIIVDDGGTDDARQVVESFGDPRLRYFWQEPRGISAARNHILQLSRGYYTAVIDDDDLMHPRRLEWHLEGLQPGTAGNCGSFVNFDDESGELTLIVSMVPSLATAAEKGGAPGHGTWFIETATLQRFRYDETITSGVDNNLMLRMLHSGVRISHTGKPVTLRRLHPGQVTAVDSPVQQNSASSAFLFLSWRLGSHEQKELAKQREKSSWPPGLSRKEMLEEIAPYLPDRLTSRILLFRSSELPEAEWDGELSTSSLTVGDTVRQVLGVLRNASYQDMVRARKAHIDFEVVTSEEEVPQQFDWLETASSQLLNNSSTQSTEPLFCVVSLSPEQPAETSLQVSYATTSNRVSCWLTTATSTEAQRILDQEEGSFAIGQEFLEGAS